MNIWDMEKYGGGGGRGQNIDKVLLNVSEYNQYM